jgi:hypothetical protein
VEDVGLKTASSCCGQECRVEGNATNYYVCVWCGKPCDDLMGLMEEIGIKEDNERKYNGYKQGKIRQPE